MSEHLPWKSDGMVFPDRRTTEAQLWALAHGRLSPEAASDWAMPYVTDESTHPDQMDQPVWHALTQMGGADLRSAPGEYLYGGGDYRAWLSEFRRAIEAS